MKNEDKNITLEAIAKQWADLVLAHIEANKQRDNASANKNKKGYK